MTPEDPLGGYGSKYAPAPGDVDRPAAAKPIARYPVTYSPRSNTKPNTAALPPVAAMANMELAERELPFPLSAYQTAFREAVQQWMRWSYGWSAAAVAVLVLGEVDERLWALGLWAIFAGVVVAFGQHPVEFAVGWLYSFPRLMPKTRREHRRRYPSPAAPSLGGLIFVVTTGVALPLLSPVLAAVAFGGSALMMVIMLRARRLGALSELLPLCFSYGSRSLGAPGVWVAPRALAKRRQDLAVLFVFGTTVGVAISMQLPWELWIEKIFSSR